MTFLYPLGLLGLIGIPILIVIYIIKSKYAEQTIASTYLWRLSERFLKRRKKINPVAGLISLILQILTVTTISLLIAHPTFTLKGAANEYCFILDASGSMCMEESGVTRFDMAKEKVSTMVEEAVDGSAFTLISVGNDAEVIYERLEDKEMAKSLLSELIPSHCGADYTHALSTAQRVFDNNTSCLVYLVTDATVESQENIRVLNVADPDVNYAVKDVTYTLAEKKVTVIGNLFSYGENTSLPISLYINGAMTPSVTQTIEVSDGEAKAFQLEAAVETLSSVKVTIDRSDALSLDNECVVYNLESEQAYKTLIVSDQPTFLKNIISACTDAEVKVITPEEYNNPTGYGLYVFDGYSPATLPRDGAVWLIGTTTSIPESGFTYRTSIELEDGGIITNAGDTSSTATKLLEGLVGNKVFIKRYHKYSLYGNFSKLFSYDNNDVIFAGTNALGAREVVFAFDLHDSNITYQSDFVLLMKNLITFSFPDVVEKSLYTCGEEVEVNILSNCDSVRVTAPSGKSVYLNTDYSTDTFTLTEAGAYKLTLNVANTAREISIYSAMSEEESNPEQNILALEIQGEATNDGYDGIYDPTVLLFILLAVLFLADWGFYCYEKYQLR